ncbi:MAG: hypothetical protein ABSE73_15405 [Planctomycetota bacterium]
MKTKPFEDENVERCRAAFRRIRRRFKTFEDLCDYLTKLEKGPWPTPKIKRLLAQAKLHPIDAGAAPSEKMRSGKAAAQKKAKVAAVCDRPAARKAVHKA